MSNNGDGQTTVICNAIIKDGNLSINISPNVNMPTVAIALKLLNKHFDKMLDKAEQPKSQIVNISPDIMNRIRGK